MAISQEGRVVVSWWLRANRWGKNLLEEEGGGKATIASVSRIQRRNHIQNQTEGNGVLPAGAPSVPYHASSSLSRDSNLKSPHSASSLVFFFFLEFFLLRWLFFESFDVQRSSSRSSLSRIFATLKNRIQRVKFSWEQFLIKPMNHLTLSLVKISFDSERW